VKPWLVIVVIGATAPAAALASPAFELRLPERSAVKIGARAEISLTIAARPGHTISRDGPLAIDVSIEPAAGLDLARRRYRRDDAVDAEADAPRFEIAVAGKTAGQYRLRIKARFWVCRKRTCWPVRATGEVPVDVAPASP
jgi:hypothetical protein